MITSPSLLELLDLEAVGSDHFRSIRTETNLSGSLFGGQVLAQALRACLFTVEDRPVHSLHGYFIRPGAEDEPVLYQVERTRDGRNFTTRRVVALQNRRAIFHMEASFHGGAEGISHARRAPKAPTPDQVSAEDPFERAMRDEFEQRGAPLTLLPLVERRMVPFAFGESSATDDGSARRLLWMRAREQGLTTADLKACGLAYLSDFWLGGVAKVLHADSVRQKLTSVDHAMWFHQPTDPSDWLLYEMESDWAGNARSLANGRIYDQAGALIASVAQEVYLFPGQMHEAARRGELQ